MSIHFGRLRREFDTIASIARDLHQSKKQVDHQLTVFQKALQPIENKGSRDRCTGCF
jgi:hypothetical protein